MSTTNVRSSAQPRTSAAGRFLYWCAGADPRMTGDSRTERVRFLGIGSSVLLTSCAAVFAMVMFVRLSVPGPWPRDLAFGLFWGLFVFTIDRWLVSSVHYGPLRQGNDGSDPGGLKKYVGALGRLLMALFLASLISGPIILELFSPEIDKQLSTTQNADRSAAADAIGDRADFVERRTGITATLKRAEETETARDAAQAKAQKDLDDEKSGRGGTGRKGCDMRPGVGACWQKTEALKQAVAAAGTARRTADAAREKAARDSAALDADIDAAVASSNSAIGRSGGSLAQEEALFQVLRAHPELWLRWGLVTGLFLLIDLMPVLLKLFGPATLHDRNVRLSAVEQAETDDEDRGVDRAEVRAGQKIRREEIEADRLVRMREIELDKLVRLRKAELRHRAELGAAEAAYATTKVLPEIPQIPEQRSEKAQPGNDKPRRFRIPMPPAGTDRSRLILNNRWAVEGRLAEGGFGDVYLARDLHHDQEGNPDE
jgi:hypothetical protein